MTRSVLADTSVWVGHFRKTDIELVRLLQEDKVLTHPMIVGEVSCGMPPKRKETLAHLKNLQTCNRASNSEVLDFIENQKLFGKGCGLIDLTLLASVLITPSTSLWTLDKALESLARYFGVLHLPYRH